MMVFENRVLRRIFGPKTVEVSWGGRTLNTDEFCVASRKHGREEKFIQNFGRETSREETNSKYLGVYGKIQLEWSLGKQGGSLQTIHLSQDMD
jgi:hypothetical protein